MLREVQEKKVLYLGLDPERYVHTGILTHFPVIKIVPRPFDAVSNLFTALVHFRYVLFTSRSAVPLYEEYALKAGLTKQALQRKKYISLGRATSQQLEAHGFQVAYCTQNETAEGVISLLEGMSSHPQRLFFPRSAQGRLIILDYLKERGVDFKSVELYDTVVNVATLPDINTFDEVIFTSPSTVHAFFALAQKLPPIDKCRSIGPVTKKALDTLKKKELARSC